VDFSEAFDEMMFRFKLKATDISVRSGVSESQISQFRKGKNVRIDTIQRILRALTPAQRKFMLDLVANEPADLPREQSQDPTLIDELKKDE
jgi:DNA-binding Xre family transcriptional regulator